MIKKQFILLGTLVLVIAALAVFALSAQTNVSAQSATGSRGLKVNQTPAILRVPTRAATQVPATPEYGGQKPPADQPDAASESAKANTPVPGRAPRHTEQTAPKDITGNVQGQPVFGGNEQFNAGKQDSKTNPATTAPVFGGNGKLTPGQSP